MYTAKIYISNETTCYCAIQLVCGMIFGMLSFLMAGLLQIYLTEPVEYCRGDVNITWQLPQLLLLAFGDVLVFVTGLEFAYSEAPPDLRFAKCTAVYI